MILNFLLLGLIILCLFPICFGLAALDQLERLKKLERIVAFLLPSWNLKLLERKEAVAVNHLAWVFVKYPCYLGIPAAMLLIYRIFW